MKLQQNFLAQLKKGDMVVTSSGIIGMIRQLGDKIVTIEIDQGVSIKVLRSQIAESATSLNAEEKPTKVVSPAPSKT